MNLKKQKKSLCSGLILSLLVICALVAIISWWTPPRFTPFIHRNPSHGEISLFGGLIDVQSEEGFVKIGSSYFSHSFEGTRRLSKYKKTIYIQFALGKFTLLNSTSSELKWNCKVLQELEAPNYIRERNTKISFQFEKFGNVNCEIHIPADCEVFLQGIQGKVYLHSPKFKFSGKIRNGKIIEN